MDAVILAGGRGTRLRAVTGDAIPKPMVDLCGRPLLERQVRQLAGSGFDRIHLVVGHLHEAIGDHFGDGEGFGTRIVYVVEDEPLGTAGGLFHLRNRLDDDFALVFGDLVFDVDWGRLLAFHRASGASATLLAHPNSHPADSDLVLADSDGRVRGFLRKNEPRGGSFHNLVNAGLYVLSPDALGAIDAPRRLDLERDVLSGLIAEGRVFAYRSTEYVRDAGVPERLAAVARDVGHGVPEARCLRNPQRAVFLDRDGTINVHRGLLTRPEDVELEQGAAEAIRLLNDSGWLCVVATNQPVVARGDCTLETLDEIHARLETLLGECGAYLDDILFCPHHPDGGYPGEVPELKGPCRCRKPAAGMIEDAAAVHNIDLSRSWVVGDTTRDVQTGVNAGTRTALVLTGEAGRDGRYDAVPDRIFPTLLDFAKHVTGGGD